LLDFLRDPQFVKSELTEDPEETMGGSTNILVPILASAFQDTLRCLSFNDDGQSASSCKMSLNGRGFVNPDLKRHCEIVNAQQPICGGIFMFSVSFILSSFCVNLR
jgi:hypothetical protein